MAVFVLGCWGFGRALLARLAPPPRRDAWLEAAMAAALGVGLFICAFQLLAIFGAFKPGATVALIAAGVVAAGLQLRPWWREVRAVRVTGAPWTRAERIAAIALTLVALPALAAPLAPPAAFDELMYHLPYARQVAQQGSLGIHEWLRYPWFPYNYNLLYAAALQVGDDVLPHFLNALAGALSAVMVYRLGIQHANRLTACIGTAIWVGIGDYSNALIDMGVALFVLSACVALWWWRESQPVQGGTRWLGLAAFCLGVAAGSKYQALTFLPLVALFVVWHERRPRAWALALLCFLVPCVYWYARNAVMTGDPFNPIGARVFGFTDWIPADYVQQVADVRDHAARPNALIWAVFLAPFSLLWKRSAALRAAGWFCFYSVAVWLLTSRYPRYLTASFPLLALMAAIGWQVLFGWMAAGVRRAFGARGGQAGAVAAAPAATMPAGRLGLAGDWVVVLLLAALAAVSLGQTAGKVAMISPTPETREAFLRQHVPGYAAMDYLRQHANGRVYQIALNEAIYYGPNPIWGDTLGPWRYRDFLLLLPGDMARKLSALGFTAIVMPTSMVPTLATRPGFDEHFALLYEKDGGRVYRILSTAP
ncbi:putative transmembrane protein [Variovorax paradoxus B4]|uniref:Putative transmembrane protein n=1 Tax=Variovorax paradoxus B4 TaxID=1246301 RepID=T1X403_VARPD|nr:phospholipid carrier-dependent glycosyltransferase [Variovorax paradoxus]AGU47338.1 putative transmembrane protein [Variovorax paradoxus B4]